MRYSVAGILTGMFIAMLAWGCSEKKTRKIQVIPEEGIWRGVIHLQDQELPFNFLLEWGDPYLQIDLINGEERINIDEVSIGTDSIHLPMHIFDSQIKAGLNSSISMEGYWRKNYLDNYRIPFEAEYDIPYRFSENPASPEADITGKWGVYFITEKDSSPAVGIFNQSENFLEGTFLTKTGDYRFLEGEVDGAEAKLSAFDGEHAYLFHARIHNEDTLYGEFWSGKTWHQSWYGVKNEEASLPDPYSLTDLKEGYDRINFQLPDLDGKMISLDDPKYRNKVVILQIFGTWCPNCMDETRFLADWYKRNWHRDVEIIAMAFERKNDLQYASSRIRKMIEKYDISYDFVFGGKSNKKEVEEVLPMLNSMISFPTLIFIDRKGKVRRIHTGFSGPGTGKHYREFIREFNIFTDKLIREEPDPRDDSSE